MFQNHDFTLICLKIMTSLKSHLMLCSAVYSHSSEPYNREAWLIQNYLISCEPTH